MNKKLLVNYIYDFSYQIFVIITPLITAPYISRVLQPEGVGVYSYTSSIASVFALFAALGVNMYGQREIAYVREDIFQRSKTFWELLIARGIATLVVTIIYICFCFLYKQYLVLFLLQSLNIFATMFDISWYFKGVENFKIIAQRNFAIKVVSVIMIFLLIRKSTDLALYVFIVSFTVLLSYVFFFFHLDKEIIKISFAQLEPRKHIKGMLEFFLPAIAVQIYSQVDKIMLGAIAQNTIENGYYEQARKIVNIVSTAVTSINTVMYPKISVLFAEKRTLDIRKYLGMTFRLITMMLVPAFIGLWFVADNFVDWFFGPGYEPTSILIKLSGILLVFMGIGNFSGMLYLNPTGNQNKGTGIYIISAVINVILNVFLIEKFQSVGAIVASIIAEAFSGITQFYLLQKSAYKFNCISGFWRYVLSGLVMALALTICQKISPLIGAPQTILEIVVAGTAYVLILYIVKDEMVCMAFKKFFNVKL